MVWKQEKPTIQTSMYGKRGNTRNRSFFPASSLIVHEKYIFKSCGLIATTLYSLPCLFFCFQPFHRYTRRKSKTCSPTPAASSDLVADLRMCPAQSSSPPKAFFFTPHPLHHPKPHYKTPSPNIPPNPQISHSPSRQGEKNPRGCGGFVAGWCYTEIRVR